MSPDTISAISSPLGPAGVGVVRLSGPEAPVILKKIFVPRKSRTSPSEAAAPEFTVVSHRVYYGHIQNPASGKILDEALVFYMKAPNSFTREDVVEIQSHGGMINLHRILGVTLDQGARLADPGEFTKRAFLNGRIELTQAESVIDLITAPCEIAADIASAQMTGALRADLEEIAAALVALRSRCEAGIEFDETDDAGATPILFHIRQVLVEDLLPRVKRLIQRHAEMAIYRTGMVLTLAGAPNVGKSSLMNRLVDSEVSIVTEFPGTTRDVLKAWLSIDGIPVVACDTAGIHDSMDPIESIGIAKARESFDRADIVLLVVDGEKGIRSFEADFLRNHLKKNIIAVINKKDRCTGGEIRAIHHQLDETGIPSVSTVAITGEGMDALKKAIVHQVAASPATAIDLSGGIPNLRQKKQLEAIVAEMAECVKMCDAALPLDMISDIMGGILHQIDDISGRSGNRDLYEEIFSRFCVGK